MDVVGVCDYEGEEHGLVDEPSAALWQRFVEDFVVQDRKGVIECGHDVLDLARGGVGPLLCLGALGFYALLLGLQDLLGDAAFVVELYELLLLPGQVVQPAGVAG